MKRKVIKEETVYGFIKEDKYLVLKLEYIEVDGDKFIECREIKSLIELKKEDTFETAKEIWEEIFEHIIKTEEKLDMLIDFWIREGVKIINKKQLEKILKKASKECEEILKQSTINSLAIEHIKELKSKK